ncbi:TolC family protein [Accumulibacter sp.]|uniref:TolC family protein n=1 Tax=Accumulibacter sp. TaxID=2053492 RepID=UPI0025D331DF|nr:TolC family protein [Accumulibacter sp.]MCM8627140.1 TolC family protein [Accumulibacter sp.]
MPGATVDQLLVLARRLNPDVAAAALESEAARARVDAAGRLPDPTFATEFKDIDRQRDSALPEELARVEYKIQQSFPLWGKLQLQESGARARAGAARETQRATELEIAARIKTIFAAYYAAFESGRVTRDLYGTVAMLADVTQSRYAQGLGEQEDAIRAEVEKTRLRTDLVRFGADQRQRAAQLNALLDRAQDAPLAAPEALRPLPDETLELAALLERARLANPTIGAAGSQITAAEADQALVRKSWYPDVTLGVTFQQFVDQDKRSPGYEAMIGTTIPLQWGLREAWEREAAANVAAARRRQDAADARVRGDLADAFWALDGLRRIGVLLKDVQLPESRLALQTALRGYEQGRSNLNAVLDTEQRVFETMLRLLAVQVEQQVRLAEIERLIGSDL